MTNLSSKIRLLGAGVALAAVVVGGGLLFTMPNGDAQANNPPAAPQATPVSVATVEQRDMPSWAEFSGRLEAVERVEVRSRVAGVVQSVHFREGALVKQGDLLFTIDPAPYAAEVDRARAQLVALQARVDLSKSDYDRGRQLVDSGWMTRATFDQRAGAFHEAVANLKAAQANLQVSRLNLTYSEVRAPVSGRVGKVEITQGNVVAAGAGAPVLTTLVSVNPIYASFDADEQILMRALKTLPASNGALAPIERIPVEMGTALSDGLSYRGKLQLVDNQVDPRSGTVRVRAVFDNADGALMAGQFARLRMGQAKAEPIIAISERAVGTDQNKKFVMVVTPENKAAYREVLLGPSASDGLRVVNDGLKPGERIVPQDVPMTTAKPAI
jgi:multidrug efflux system membrane fusion protein